MTPELAVVVLAVGDAATTRPLGRALASLARQEPPLEVVVVHSGTGGAPLPPLPPWASRQVFAELLPTGETRNRGIRATRAPFVAFLSFDCTAMPGWAAARLEAHRAGADWVSAALVNEHRSSLVAWAEHIVLHHRRWPRVPAAEALHYGASYSRELLERSGGFRSGLAAGEDTELGGRLLAMDVRPTWCPSARATHPYATSLAPYLADQEARGARAAESWLALGDRERAAAVTRDPGGRATRAVRFSLRYAEPRDRAKVLLASPLVAWGAARYARGARQAIAAL